MRGQVELLSLAIATGITMLLITAGILWYASQDTAEESIRTEVAMLAATLPEWQCSYNGQVNANCVDLLRVTMLGSDYFTVFGYSTITLEYITQDWQKIEVVLYSDQKQDFVEKRTFYEPVSVYDAKTGLTLAGNVKAEVFR